MNARLRTLLIASALGAVAARLAESALAPLVFVSVATLWLLWPRRRAPSRPRTAPPVQSSREAQRERAGAPPEPLTTGTAVVCKRVTAERQEWVSRRTGRLYDVLSHHGLPNARPGDRGRVALTPTGWRIVPDPVCSSPDPSPPCGQDRTAS